MNKGFENARKAQERARNAGIPIKQLNPIERAAQDPASKAKAIVAKCYDCIYDPLDRGNWRDQVNACESFNCPLWTVRPTK